MQIAPAELFKRDGKVLDPRDERNRSEIDKAIKETIKALKK